MLRQTNLERNCLEKFLKPKVAKLLDRHTSSIKSKNLNAAFDKVDEVKAIASKALTQMSLNMEQAEEL